MSNNNRTIYIGVTNDLFRRVQEHKALAVDGFTKRYKVTSLVYYETTPDIRVAIEREKEIKSWLRQRKLNLILSMNPRWLDLYDVLIK